MQQWRRADTQFEQGDVEGALAILDDLAASAPSPTVRHAARMQRGQIRGVFSPRQAFWLDRRVGDVVVLVPDERAFLEAIRGWTPERFWPILIEDGWFAPMFIRAFRPSTVWRFAPPRDGNSDRVHDDLLAFVKTLNADLSKTFSQRPRPPGLVMLDPKSDQRMGGLALAWGRGQPATTAMARTGGHAVVAFEPLLQFNAQLMKSARKWRLNDPETWFAVTLAGPYPYRYEVPSTAENVSETGGPDDPWRLRAVDDLIGRIHASDSGHDVRLAVAGRLTGSPPQSIYQAMCSLFLQPQRMLWVDALSHKEESAWQRYAMRAAMELLAPRYDGTLLARRDASIATVQRHTRPTHAFDMIWINSRGGAKVWHLDVKARTDDFPIGHPTAMHVVHSFSMARPWHVDTLAGRAIAGGAYWYFGSISEPFLTAFNRPASMAAKIRAGTPPAFAARQIVGQERALPWRLMLVGDPLYMLRAEPAPRDPMPTVTHAVRVDPGEDRNDPRHALRTAVLLGDPGASALAEALLEQAEILSPDDLILVLGTLYRAGQHAAVARVPHRTARTHAMASVLARLSRVITEMARSPADTSRSAREGGSPASQPSVNIRQPP